MSLLIVAFSSAEERSPSRCAHSPATRASRLVQELVIPAMHRGADQGDGRKSLISFTTKGRRYNEKVARTLEDAILRYFVEPLDEEVFAGAGEQHVDLPFPPSNLGEQRIEAFKVPSVPPHAGDIRSDLLTV
jgi:hypothetical protein